MHYLLSRARVTRALIPLFVLISAFTPISTIVAQGVRYTLAPSAEYTWWDKSLGIADATLLGGRVGADFGSLVSVSGFFHTKGGVGLTRDSVPFTLGAPVHGRTSKTDITTYGIDLALRLGQGRIAPFASVGAGVIRFAPDSARAIDQITYRYGGGFHIDATPNVRGMIKLENSMFRLAPGTLFGGPSSSATGATGASDGRTTRSNLVLTAGLGIAVGGDLGQADPSADHWSFASIPVEAFAGRLEFDDKSMPRQSLVGVRTGIDVGNYVGLRGFYWQGRSSDLKRVQLMNGYGAEAQFNFNASRGIAPFLIAGAARLDYDAAYRDTLGRKRADETALILGGGIGLRLSDAFRLNVAARDYVRGPQQLDSIATIKQLSNNWMYTVGVAYNIARSRRAGVPEAETRHDVAFMRDSIYQDRSNANRSARDSARSPRDASREASRERFRDSTGRDSRQGTNDAPRMISLPVPIVGELYVRYGDGTSRVFPAAGAPPVRDSMKPMPMPMPMPMQMPMSMPPAAPTIPVPAVGTDSILRSLRDRIDSLEAALRRRDARPVVIDVPATMMVPTTSQPVTRRSSDASPTQISKVSAYVAGFDQPVIGVQVDAGSVFGIEQLRFVPDFAVGLGAHVSLSLAAGAQYEFPSFRLGETATLQPHARLGLGFLAASGDRQSEFGVNVAYGLTYLGSDTNSASRRPKLFIEHQGINFFSTNRFLLGLRFAVR